MTSKRKRLFRLVKLHPDWSYKQYAEALDQSVDSVRGALSALKLSKKTKEKPAPKVKMRLPEKVEPRKSVVASKASSTRFGYTKLM